MAEPTKTRAISEILSLHQLLSQLDAHVETTTGPDGNALRGKTTAYDFGIKARYAIITNLGLTERVAKKVQKAQDAEIRKQADGADQISRKDENYEAKLKAVQDEMKRLLESEETLNFRQIPIEELNLAKNPLLPNSLVAALGDLVSEPA